MKKRILSIVLGLLTGFLAITAGESFSSKVFPLPEGLNMHDKAQMITAVNNMPLNAFLLLLSIYAIAALSAGVVSTMVAQTTGSKIKNPDIEPTADNDKTWRPAMICCLVLTLAGIIEASSLAMPTWFILANVIVYVPSGYLGYLVVRRR